MSAPFDLPDLCDIVDFETGLPLAQDVPCRQVPNLKGVKGGGGGAAAMQWTHWVDFQPDVFVRDNSVVPVGFLYPQQGLGDTLVFLNFDENLHLRVVWVETRFTNTPNAYLRCYCVRVLREV